MHIWCRYFQNKGCFHRSMSRHWNIYFKYRKTSWWKVIATKNWTFTSNLFITNITFFNKNETVSLKFQETLGTESFQFFKSSIYLFQCVANLLISNSNKIGMMHSLWTQSILGNSRKINNYKFLCKNILSNMTIHMNNHFIYLRDRWVT